MAAPKKERALKADAESQLATINVPDGDADGPPEPFYKRKWFYFAVIALAVVGVVLAIGLVFGTRNATITSTSRSGNIADPVPGDDVTPSPAMALPVTASPVTASPVTVSPVTVSPVTALSVPPTVFTSSSVQEILATVVPGGGSAFEDEASYQYQALAWLEGNKDVEMYSSERLIQRYALACFFYTTFGIENAYTGEGPVEWMNNEKWMSDDNECKWHGINCSGKDIVSLDLSNNNVTGTVPPEFGLLGRSLQLLDLSGNAVANKDEELSWIAELTELTELHLYFCNFDSHGISTYIGALTKLEYLDLSYTLMFGGFNGEAVFTNLTNLQVLELGGNLYNESIPSEIASLPTLSNLYIDNAMVTGDLSFIANMPVIFELWIDSNDELTGPLPASIGNAATLASFSATDCSITGSIPTEIGLLTGMQQMWLQNNELSGAIPTEFGNLDKMLQLHLEGNMLSGFMPNEVCENAPLSLGSDCPDSVDCVCCTCCGSPCEIGVSGSDGSGYAVETIINRVALRGGAEFEDPNSAQSKALKWVKNGADASIDSAAIIIQRYTLAVLFFSTSAAATNFTNIMYGAGNPVLAWKESEGWLSATPECSWYGVRCTPEGVVDGLDLPSNDLTGGIPNEIVLLANSLIYIDISGNFVSNAYEELAWMGELTKLTYFDMHFCNFEFDGVPTYLENLVKLEVLDISYTFFYGELNGSIFSNMNKLSYLEMGGNSYNSALPLEIASLPELQYLYSEFTHLSGDLSFIDYMDKIVELWVDYNPDLVGAIPASIGEKTTLKSLSLSDCGLTGSIPSEVGLLAEMEQMWLYNNALSGPIPTAFEALDRLTTLHLEGNELSGVMPIGVCALRETSLVHLASDCKFPAPEVMCVCCTCCESPCSDTDMPVSHELMDALAIAGVEVYDEGHAFEAFKWLDANSEIGTYSAAKLIQRFSLACVYMATSSVETVFTEVKFGNGTVVPGWNQTEGWMSNSDECSWYGITCDVDGAVSHLLLAYNGLSGTFPQEISLLSSTLVVLDIGGNIVAGSLEELDWIGSLTNLKELDVHSCNFYFTGIPEGIMALTQLESLDISYCLFFGPLDGTIFFGLDSLFHLEMGGNSFNSSLPSEIAALPNLEFLYVDHADLIGDLSFLPDMDMIFELWVDFNPLLQGSIPFGIGTVTSLQSFSVADCGLTGSIPTTIGLMTNMQQMWLYNNNLTGNIPSEISNLVSLHHFHTEGNLLTGAMPTGVCALREISLQNLATDCVVPNPEVECECCTCCGFPCIQQDNSLSGSGALETAGINYSGRVQTQAANWIDSSSALNQYSNDKLIQRYALACIFLSTNGVETSYTDSPANEWIQSDGWLSDTDECSWYGIQCNEDGFVNVTDLSFNDLTGSFPNETSLLGNSLTYLDISGNNIFNEGDDLAWISRLIVLKHFDAHLLNFKYDGVPPVFPSSLKVLDISYTLFFGELDGASFAGLTNLEYLAMGGNYYGSVLPAELVELPSLSHLYVDNSGVMGDLTFISSMQNISELWIDFNPGFGGSIPTEIGQVSTLASLSLAGCCLEGTIPSEIGLLSDMQQLWLYNNTLTGTIPMEIASLTSLVTFQTQTNELSGEMPAEICALRNVLLGSLTTDCREPNGEVECACCTCCEAPCYGDFAVNAQSVLEDKGVSYEGRYQSIAYRWIQVDPALQTYEEWRVIQRFALACIYYATYKGRTSYTDTHFGADTEVPGWENEEGWITSADECEWFGIECDENGAVVAVKLPFNRLTGTMPKEITLLSESLTYLDVSGNVVASEDEALAWIAALPNLKHLDAHLCNFAYDGIPPYVSALSHIEFLDISYTLFFGELNGAFFVPLTKLSYLEMGGNYYDGSLPSEIASLPKLQHLYVEHSGLTGGLSFLDTMGSIKEMWLDQNPDLQGSIPTSIGNVVTLASLSLSNCGLTGEIPSTVGLLTDMKQMWLFNNSLTGYIPTEISNLSQLRAFHTENNDLNGTMPQEICALRDDFGGNLTSLATDCVADPTAEVECTCCTCCQEECYSDYAVSGSSAIEDAGFDASNRYQSQATLWLDNFDRDLLQTYSDERILQLYALASIYLSTNGVATSHTSAVTESGQIQEWVNSVGWLTEDDECTWFGIECNKDGIVTKIDLPYNKMTGIMPPEIEILASGLEYLDISGNEISSVGSDLDWIQSLTSLKHLDVHFNYFEYDGVPPYFVSLTNLAFLDISYTLFFGELEGSAFSGLNALEYLEMGGNFYGSSVPTEITSLPSLGSLYIENSQLIGDISFIDTMSVKIFEFWIDDNAMLGGSIPGSIGNLTALESLSMTNCAFTGSIPSEMGELTSMKQIWLSNNTLTGSIPEEMAELSKLNIFHTDDNELSGKMPDSICVMRDVFGGPLETLTADCVGDDPEVDCVCCTCCESPCL